MAPGTYTVHVWANQAGDSQASFEGNGSSTITLTGCTSAALGASPASPQLPGTMVQVTASSSGCANPVYEFWLEDTSGGWSMKQAFGTSAAWSWDTTSYPTGVYTIHVWANQQGGNSNTWQALAELTFTLGSPTPPPPPGPCTSASISPASPSQPAGSTVNFTASSTGCPNPLYEYWLQSLDGSWNIQRGFSAEATWSWNTAGLAPGTYTVHVWANQTGDSQATFEGNGSSTITLTGCTAASLSPSSGSAAVGATVTFTAASGGCPNPVYEFWLQDPTGGWSMRQAFGPTGTWSWDTTGYQPGSYTIHVWANQQGGNTNTWQAIGSATFALS